MADARFREVFRRGYQRQEHQCFTVGRVFLDGGGNAVHVWPKSVGKLVGIVITGHLLDTFQIYFKRDGLDADGAEKGFC